LAGFALFLLAADGLFAAETWLKEKFGKKVSALAAIIIVFLIALSFLPSIQKEIASREAFLAGPNSIALTPVLAEMEKDLPENCYMVTGLPSLFATTKIRAMSQSFVKSAAHKGSLGRECLPALLFRPLGQLGQQPAASQG
jgi:hypothetical protein